MAGNRTGKQIILRLLFVLYGGLMLWLLFGQRASGDMTASQNWNLIPFKTLKLYVQIIVQTENAQLLRHAFINLAGNVVMFIPLGFFLPAIWRRQQKIWLFLVSVILLIVGIEAAQYITNLGSCDVDDFLLNLPGALLGYILQRLIAGRRR